MLISPIDIGVIRTWISAPRPPGSMMVICDDGQVAGSVMRLPETTTYGPTAEEARRFGLPFEGAV